MMRRPACATHAAPRRAFRQRLRLCRSPDDATAASQGNVAARQLARPCSRSRTSSCARKSRISRGSSTSSPESTRTSARRRPGPSSTGRRLSTPVTGTALPTAAGNLSVVRPRPSWRTPLSAPRRRMRPPRPLCSGLAGR
eukprot:scaffold32690_cov107-Isochrysis_galbana.AAC.5